MYGYRIPLSELPQPLFACTTHVDNYSWTNRNQPGTVEIALCDAPQIKRTLHASRHNSQETTYVSGGGTLLTCHINDEPISSSAPPGCPVEITSVAVHFPSLSARSGELAEADFQDTSVLLFPSLAENFPSTDEIRRLLRSYISHSVHDSAADRAACISIWFELASLIDRLLRMPYRASGENGANYYVKKVDSIISRQYARPLRLQEIARELGITVSYLSSVYSQSTGINFRQALLKARMNKALELASDTTLSVREIGGQIGIEDESQLRKYFKKYAGVSISEYRRINRELTLYHAKPIRKIPD